MASKRLGRLRQWAGEIVSSKDKSEATDEARELERDIEIRSEGLQRLHSSGTLYHRSISKKKATDAVDDESKMLPRDALGVVMIVHGEQLEGSLYGSSLVKLGQAHCKIALAQEAFALTLQSSYLESLEVSAEEIREYEAERKALETRRINYDAAVTALEKVQANKKAKDKDRSQAEDELVKAKLKYDEQAEDLRARIEAIQDREVEQLRDLTGMLDAELAFAEQYAEILRDVKRNWASHASINRLHSRREVGPMHNLARTPDLDGATNSSPELPSRSRSASVHARKRAGSSATAKGQPVANSAVDSDSDESDEEEHAPVMSRRSSKASKPASRPQSRSRARSRANSTATAKGEKTDDEEKGKRSRRPSVSNKSVDEKEGKSSKRMTVAAWMPSIGRKKGHNVDRDLFANLDGDDSDGEAQPPVSSAVSSRSFGSVRSKKSAGASSPVVPPRPPRDADAKQPKLVRAIYDFAGSSDELSFQSGDVIAVVSEVLDDWWMGELDGHRGLFPTTHTEEFKSTTPRIRPMLPVRAGTFGGQLTPGHPVPERSHSDDAAAHPFGDEHATNSLFSPLSATFSGDESAADTHSIADSMDDAAFLMPKKAHDEREDAFGPPGESVRQPPPPPPRRATTPKAPPPPPPRRTHSNAPSLDSTDVHTLHHSASAGSSLRRPPSSGSSLTGHSSSGLYQSASAASSASGNSGTSPGTAKGKSPWALKDSETGACMHFEQQPMRAAGMCVNCQRMHLDV